MYARFNVQNFDTLPTDRIYVVCMNASTNNDYFPIQLYLIGLYNLEYAVCFQRGTNWVFKYNTGYLGCMT
jgi:hypothetical protein